MLSFKQTEHVLVSINYLFYNMLHRLYHWHNVQSATCPPSLSAKINFHMTSLQLRQTFEILLNYRNETIFIEAVGCRHNFVQKADMIQA